MTDTCTGAGGPGVTTVATGHTDSNEAIGSVAGASPASSSRVAVPDIELNGYLPRHFTSNTTHSWNHYAQLGDPLPGH